MDSATNRDADKQEKQKLNKPSKSELKTKVKSKKSSNSILVYTKPTKQPETNKINNYNHFIRIEGKEKKDSLFHNKNNKYQPYFELGGAKYFNQATHVSGIYDLFLPLLETNNQLLFADLRIFDRSGSSAEGNFHLGYRKLYPDTKQMIGIYGAYDLKRSDKKNIFNQLTLGFEYWHNRLFIGGNVYKPIGETKKSIEEVIIKEPAIIGRSIAGIKTTNSKYYEKALSGIDAEVGFAVTDNLTGYAGGYYFSGNDIDTIAGPKVRITYDYKKSPKKILGVIDGVGIEVGAQHDKPRGYTAYVGIKLKIGITDRNSNISGFERHMVDLARRDPDIIINKAKTEKIELSGGQGYVGSKPKNYSEWTTEELLKEFNLPTDATLKDVRKKYHESSTKHHPDKGGKEDEFIRDTTIYEILKERFVSLTSSSSTSNRPPNIPSYQNESYYYNCCDSNTISNDINNDDYEYRVAGVDVQNGENSKGVEQKVILTSNKNSLSETEKIAEKAAEKIEKPNNANTEYTSRVNGDVYNNGKIALNELSEIKKMDYQYSDIDIERILAYRILEIIKEANETKEDEKEKKTKENLKNIVIVNPVSKNELEAIANQFEDQFREIKEILKKEIEVPGRKLLIPIYLDDKNHWVSAIVKNKGNKNNSLEIKYFDSSPAIEFLFQPYSWLVELLKKIYLGEISYIDINKDILKQFADSVGCGAFTIENIIKSLGLTCKHNSDEKWIRESHYDILNKYKDLNVIELVKELNKAGINYIHLGGTILISSGRNRRRFRGGGTRAAAQWAQTVTTGLGNSYFYGVTTDNSGNVYAAGYMWGTSTYNFGNSVTAAGKYSIYNILLVKYSNTGIAQWAQTVVTGPNYSIFYGVTTDSNGDVYAVGVIGGTSTYNFGNSITAIGNSNYNILLVKYSNTGSAQWAQTVTTGSNGSSQFNSVITDNSGNVYAAGSIYGISTINFGNSVTTTGKYDGGYNILLVKYSNTGTAQWAQTVVTGPIESQFNGVTTDSSGGYSY